MTLLIGATGKLGHAITDLLLREGYPVRAMTRNPEKAEALRARGAEVIGGDLVNPASLREALKGVDVVISAAHSLLGRGRYASVHVDGTGHRTLIDLAREAGVKHFIYTSALGAAADNPSLFYRLKHATEQHLINSGLTYTILRPSAFMETHAHEFLGQSILEKGKTTILGRGESRINFVSVADVAHYAVLAMQDPMLHNAVLDIGGPDNLSRNAVAELYGRLSGRTPKVSHVPPGVLRILSTIARPLHPGLSELFALTLAGDREDQNFDAETLRRRFPQLPQTTLEAFVREKLP